MKTILLNGSPRKNWNTAMPQERRKEVKFMRDIDKILLQSEKMQEENERIPKEVTEKVDKIIEDEFPDADRIFGICHAIWRRKKELYKQFGYVWYAPTDIYPGVMFD